MSNNDTSEAKCAETDLKMDSTCNIPVSKAIEDDEAFVNTISDDDDDPEITQRCSRTSSLYDDSGFNSSSEDREDVAERVLRQKCGTDSIADGHSSIMQQNTHCLIHQNEKLCNCLNQKDLTFENFDENSIEGSEIINKLNVNSISNINMSAKNHVRISRRQRTDNSTSLVVSQTTTNTRTPRNRRQQPRDINNNDPCHRNFNSYIGKSQFRLQACFQDKGLVSLLVCITYTLLLMVVFCVLGGISQSLKSAIGKENLKYIQQDIVQSRRSRPSMASG